MKYLIFMLIFISSSNSCEQKKSEIENKLLSCLEKSFDQLKLDLNKELDKYERHLINTGTLVSNNGQSYFDFYKSVASLDDFPEVVYFDDIKKLTKIKPNEFASMDCLQNLSKLKRRKIINSKSYQLTLKMNEIAQSGNFPPSLVANTIISVLSPSDFDENYFRAKALLTIAHISNVEPKTKKLNFDETVDYTDFSSVSIFVNEKSEIFYNKEIIIETVLKNELRSFIKQNKKNHVIVFEVDKETKYNFYLKVLNFISDTYSKLRNEESTEIFKKPFPDLTDQEKEKILEIYPKNIIEK